MRGGGEACLVVRGRVEVRAGVHPATISTVVQRVRFRVRVRVRV
jgi:hypothetical protein